ncbi:MAG TPA: hypothetical protein VFU35_03115 [Jatrophihabitans sp.]|nr:hypothetical protein [Jatrophihabitans sp.]
MAGYSGTPQAGKLGLKPGMRVSVENAPAGWSLTDPPGYEDAAGGPADLILRFVQAAAELDGSLAGLGRRIHPAGALWVLWPRKAAGHVSDVNENAIRDAVLPLGLVDVKVAAVDTDWSGLKVVWRRDRR